MRRMDLDAVEASLPDECGGVDEALDDVPDVGLGRCAWLAEVAPHIQLHLGGRQRRQVHQPRALAAGVADLCPQLAATVMHRLGPGAQLGQA